jgi:hypothetical protein
MGVLELGQGMPAVLGLPHLVTGGDQGAAQEEPVDRVVLGNEDGHRRKVLEGDAWVVGSCSSVTMPHVT